MNGHWRHRQESSCGVFSPEYHLFQYSGFFKIRIVIFHIFRETGGKNYKIPIIVLLRLLSGKSSSLT